MSTNGNSRPGLSWPNHDSGPTPPPEYNDLRDRLTRRPVLLFVMFAMVMQFVAIFWFLSKGGMDTYMPEDIKTRFSDVWGQDNVLDKVRENMVFLEDPESIEN